MLSLLNIEIYGTVNESLGRKKARAVVLMALRQSFLNWKIEAHARKPWDEKQGAAWARLGKGNWAVKLLWLGKWAMSSMEKAGLLPGWGSQPQKCPGDSRKMKLGSGNEGLVVSCFGISGLFSQQQSHPCCLSSNSWAGEMSQAAGNDWGRRKFLGREGISWLFARAVEALERMESVSLVLSWIPTPLLPFPRQRGCSWAHLPKTAKISSYESSGLALLEEPHIYLSLISWDDIVADSASLQAPRAFWRPVWEFDSKLNFSL